MSKTVGLLMFKQVSTAHNYQHFNLYLEPSISISIYFRLPYESSVTILFLSSQVLEVLNIATLCCADSAQLLHGAPHRPSPRSSASGEIASLRIYTALLYGRHQNPHTKRPEFPIFVSYFCFLSFLYHVLSFSFDCLHRGSLRSWKTEVTVNSPLRGEYG